MPHVIFDVIVLVCYVIYCYYFYKIGYLRGKRDQMNHDKKIIDGKLSELVERVDGIINRHRDPNRPEYIDRQ